MLNGPASAASSEPTLELGENSPPTAWFVELAGDDRAEQVMLELGEHKVLGTRPGAALRLSDRAVSGQHCRISACAAGLLVEDLGSRNGTFVGPARVSRALITPPGGAFVVGKTSVSARPLRRELDVAVADSLPGVTGTSAAMRGVSRDVRRYASLRAPVLIQGESGTGKDVIARAIHELSRRRGAYIPINVSAFPETLVDAELFGHRKGAFTGALTSRAGAFEQADAGTLFLDEIADLVAAVQVKLLRVVEDGMVRPIGGAPTRVDARIVSASWADLPELCRSGRFREDLYHRLSTFVIRLPPLRERKSDLAPLCRALLGRIESELGEKQLSTAALARLVAHHWPGNVRELFSVLYRAAAATSATTIGAEAIAFTSSLESAAERPRGPGVAKALLREHGGNVSAAARAAGVARSTFRSWLQRGEALQPG